jgi:hypothetical protein
MCRPCSLFCWGSWRLSRYLAPEGDWNDDDYGVLAEGDVVGRIYKANAAPVGMPWMDARLRED